MGEGKGKDMKETLADEAKGLAVEVYHDAGQGAAKRIGETAEGALAVALKPVNLLIKAAGAGWDLLFGRVEKKLDERGVPPERRQLPPGAIAGPAALQYMLLGEGPEVSELRAMFENLLTASMDSDTATGTHPAFVSMISQMTQDEAWLLESITADDFPAIQIKANMRTVGVYTTIGRDLKMDRERQSTGLANLERLNILRFEYQMADDYEAFRQLEAELDREFPNDSTTSTVSRFIVTPLGRRFLDLCVRPPRNRG